MNQKLLFEEELRLCEQCHRTLPREYKKSICPSCEEIKLFGKVKEYIRANEVTEYDVSEHFHISRKKVKSWIKEGRIEYKDPDKKKIRRNFCLKCGCMISFGELCEECLKKERSEPVGVLYQNQKTKNGNFRYVKNKNIK